MKSVPDKFDAILIKLMVLGDSNVGKTTFIHRYVEEEYSDKYITTVGIDFREKNLEIPNDNRRISLQVKTFADAICSTKNIFGQPKKKFG